MADLPPISFSLAPPVDRLISALPLYLQIAEGLLERIEAGELAPGTRLPAERELAGQLGVNRLTIRRALRVLEGQGLISRKPGRGTHVAQPRIDRQASQIISFTRGMQRRGFVPGARLVSIEQRPVEAYLAGELRLALWAPVYIVLRVRTLNQEPVLLERYTLPQRRFPNIDQLDLGQGSVFDILEREYGVQICRARQSLEPIIATDYEAALLDVEPGAPLMLERRVSYDRDDQPVEAGRDMYRGDRFRFVTQMAAPEVIPG
jgi:GntR family transcriptional regulator